MFGNNPKRPPLKGDGKFLDVQEIFPTLQGEGANSGMPAVFIRLGGCNLACNFCDTEFENFQRFDIEHIIDETDRLSRNNLNQQAIKMVVITGGEPLRQPIGLLCSKLLALGFKVQLETNGTLYQTLPEEVEIVCSPKVVKGKHLNCHSKLLPRISAFKFLISTSVEGYDKIPELGQTMYNIPVFIQPMDELSPPLNKKNIALAIDLALNNGYRLSYQLHKILGIN